MARLIRLSILLRVIGSLPSLCRPTARFWSVAHSTASADSRAICSRDSRTILPLSRNFQSHRRPSFGNAPALRRSSHVSPSNNPPTESTTRSWAMALASARPTPLHCSHRTCPSNRTCMSALAAFTAANLAGSEWITETVRNAFLLPPMHPTFIQQPTNRVAGSTITPPVTVQIFDTADNPVNATFAVTVTLGNNLSGATLSGTKTVSAVNGLATFNDLSIDKAGSYRLTASGQIFSAASTMSNQFTITAPTSSAIAATAGSGQSATINSSFATALQATVTDATGNPVSGVNVTFTAPASGASGQFANNTTTTTATTNASGVATASSFTANGTAGTYTVAASINSGSTVFSLNNLKANQVISVTTHAPASAANNAQFNVAAASSSGLPVSYSSGFGACTNNGAAFTIAAGQLHGELRPAR